MRLLAAAAALGLAAMAGATAYKLPPETVPLGEPGDDADLVRGRCMGCHSLDYLATQPRGRGPDFWKATVTKMNTAYGASIPDDEAARIVAFLAKRY